MDSVTISAVILDDHLVVAQGVRAWCESAAPPIRLVDARGDLNNLWSGPGAAADVVIFDLSLFSGDRQEFGELERLVSAGRRVVVYSGDTSSDTVMKCIDLGALAYITKAEGGDHLVAALQSAAAGGSYTGPSLSGAIAADNNPNRPHLTPLELSVMRAWFASSSKRLAARKLHLSPHTVDRYIERVRVRYAAVGRAAPTKTALVTRALEDGVITLADLYGTGT